MLQDIAPLADEASLPLFPAVRGELPTPAAPAALGRATSAGAGFRILHLHARGGLGEVFLARDEELGRDVALKGI